jgi:hypothetical protein
MPANTLTGRQKLELIRELAMQATSQAELSRRFELSEMVVSHFKTTYEQEIADVRKALLADVKDETAGLWIADKAKRIAEYQEDVEMCDKALLTSGLDPAVMKVKHNALKSVAEELGSLPTRAPTEIGDKVYVTSTVQIPKDLKDSLT